MRIKPFTVLFIIWSALFASGPALQAQHQVYRLKPIIQKSSQAQAEADSLKALLKITSKGTSKIDLYGELCYLYANTIGNVVVAHSYADSIKLLAEELRNERYLAASNYYYGMVARHECKYTVSLHYLEKQVAYCKTTGDSALLANTLFQMAVVTMYQGNYEKSLAIHYRAIELYQKEVNQFGTAITFMTLGNLLVRMNKYDHAFKMYDKTLATLNSLKADLNVKMYKLRVLINMGNAYAAIKQYEKARMFYSQSLPISDLLGSKRTEATALSSIGDVLNVLQQHDSALVYHLKALSIREQTSQREKIIISLIQVGETYMFLKNYPTAAHYLVKALSMAKSLQAKPCIRDAYQKLTALYQVQGNFQKAYQYHQLFSVMKDSLLNEQNTRQLNELHTKYETGEKDKRIALLSKEKEIQEKEAQRQATLKKAFIGGLLLVIILAVLLMYTFRQRLLNQRIIAAKNDEIKEVNFKQKMSELEMKALRAQMNPHFIFNAMNSINRMILESDPDAASQYLAKFSKLIRLILENAEKTTVSLQNELAMLESYIQLEDLRFKGRINYEIQVDETIDRENTYLPSMVLQPFVENAIWHGLMHKEKNEQGFIRVAIHEQDDTLLCSIEDNGVGREKAIALQEKSVLKSKSMGLQITEERLKLLGKKRIRQLIHITDMKDSLNHALGTRIDIRIPLL